MYTRIGAILGSVVGGVLALAAFWAGLASMGGGDEGDAMGHLAFALMIIFTVPAILLGNIMGVTVGTLVGGLIDRRGGRESIIRGVLGVAYIVFGIVSVALALVPTIVGVAEGEWAWTVTGVAGIAAGAGLCFGAWWMNRRRHLL